MTETTFDPFGGKLRPHANLPPFNHSLVVTPDDDRDLPVIPSAIYVPARIDVPYEYRDEPASEGQQPSSNGLYLHALKDDRGEFLHVPAGHDPDLVGSEYNMDHTDPLRQIAMQMHNGEKLSMRLPRFVDFVASEPPVWPLRPRRIMRTGTAVHQIILLW